MPRKNKEKLLIIDGNAVIHRSFHALPPTMTTSDGAPVNAVYGFAKFLLTAIKEFKPEYLVLTLDKKGPTFRHKKFKEYKATRVKAPDELYAQIPLVKRVAEAFAIPIFEKSGFEADDLIGTVCREVDGSLDKIVMTGDLDTLQLVDDDTYVFTMSRGLTDSVLYDEKKVRQRFGFGPGQLVDYKALRGDPSDNIPGVPGIGDKTATELIKEFSGLDNLYNNLDSDKLKPRIKKLLDDNKEQAYLSRDLATIDRQVSIKFDLSKAEFGEFDEARVYQLFSELEFKSLLNQAKSLMQGKGQNSQQDKLQRNQDSFTYSLIDDSAKFKGFLRQLKKQQYFTFDTETSGLDNFNASLLGISFSWKKGEAYFVSLFDRETRADNLFNYQSAGEQDQQSHPWLKQLKPVFEDASVKKRGHNLKFDLKVLQSFGIETAGVEFDTMIASYLLNPDNRQHGLDALVFTELGFEKISSQDLLGKGKDKIDYADVPLDKLASYACEDADFTERLVKPFSQKLKEDKLYQLFRDLEMPLVWVLAKMENNGVKISPQYFDKLDQELDKKIKQVQKKIWKIAGRQFNIASVQQLREILFKDLQIETDGIAKTKTGFSTGASELEKLRDKHEIVELILDYRELSKISNTYVKALPKLINKKTGRVHTSFNQAVAATGRLSSTNPNLQNIPQKGDWGKKIRQGFIAEKGKTLLAMDYSQIELRLAAHMSDDPTMIKAFKNGQDIHRATAAAVNDVSPEAVTKDMRYAAKAVNFGLLYGQGPHGLSQTTGLNYFEAKKFIDQYFKTFGSIKQYIDDSVEKAKEKGYAATLLGRRRYLPDIHSSVGMVRKAAERVAVNMPLQGTAADMIKIAMIEVQNLIEKKYQSKIKMILQVHDELIFELDDELAAEAAAKFKRIMESVVKLSVPVIVDAKAGKNWEEMQEIK